MKETEEKVLLLPIDVKAIAATPHHHQSDMHLHTKSCAWHTSSGQRKPTTEWLKAGIQSFGMTKAPLAADKSVPVYGRRLLSWCEELTIYMQLDHVFNVVVNTLISGSRVACMQSQYDGHI